MRNGSFHYIKGIRQSGYTLIDERNGITLSINGFNELEKQLDDTNKADISARMLNAAEHIIVNALDTEMLRHPGPLQKSLQSTGAKKNARGGWYLSYRATTGNERASDNRTNPEKMVYLVNREYIRTRNGKEYHRKHKGKDVIGFEIPADDVIGEAIEKSESAIVNAMQAEFDKAIDEIWG